MEKFCFETARDQILDAGFKASPISKKPHYYGCYKLYVYIEDIVLVHKNERYLFPPLKVLVVAKHLILEAEVLDNGRDVFVTANSDDKNYKHPHVNGDGICFGSFYRSFLNVLTIDAGHAFRQLQQMLCNFENGHLYNIEKLREFINNPSCQICTKQYSGKHKICDECYGLFSSSKYINDVRNIDEASLYEKCSDCGNVMNVQLGKIVNKTFKCGCIKVPHATIN